MAQGKKKIRARFPFFRIPAAAVFAAVLLCALPAHAEQERVAIDLSALSASANPPTWRVNQGSRVEIVVSTEEPAELHLHGYDLSIEAEPGEPGVLRFDASVAGRFPLTRHGHGGGHDSPLGYLEIYPN